MKIRSVIHITLSVFLTAFIFFTSCTKETIADENIPQPVESSACVANSNRAYLDEIEGLYSCHPYYFIIDHDINYHESGNYSLSDSKLLRIIDSIEIADNCVIDTNNIKIEFKEIAGLQRTLGTYNDALHQQINSNNDIQTDFPEYKDTGNLQFYLYVTDITNNKKIISDMHPDEVVTLTFRLN